MTSLHERVRAWAMGSPRDLAIFRVVVGVVLLRLPDLHHATAWSRLPDRVRTPPIGLEWTIGVLPLGPEIATPLYWVVVVATVLGVVGLGTRLAWTTVSLAGLYLLAIPQYAGSVFHYHHLLWFAMLLAASPSGDALSVDAWLSRRRGRPPPPARALAYGVPIRAVWLLIGVIFFFPGVHKLVTSGAAWIFSDNLRNQLYAKWFQNPGYTPLFRIDRYPTLLRLGALSTVALELSFFALVLFRRTRLIAVLGALAFHQSTAYFMGLRFPALWLTYVAFVDWEAVLARMRALRGQVHVRLSRTAAPPEVDPDAVPDTPEVPAARSLAGTRATLCVAAVLLVGNVAYGALGISDGWPFACYPKFHRTVEARLPALRVELVLADGATREVPVTSMSPAGPTQRWWAVTWSLMGAHERARADPRRFAAFWQRMARRPAIARLAEGAVAVRFHKDLVSTVPEESRAPPLATRLLYELPLAVGAP